MNLLVVIDIDGTLADFRVRAANAGHMPQKEERREFQEWLNRLQKEQDLLGDKPISGMRSVVMALYHAGAKLFYLTGRGEDYRETTAKWLELNQFPRVPLLMREMTDWRSAADYKEGVMKILQEEHSDHEIITIDDDWEGDCAERYSRNGWTHLKVQL